MKRRQQLSMALAALTTATIGGGLSGCASGPQVADYALETPIFDLRTYFNGRVNGWGIFTDRAGKVVKRFVVTMNCSWVGDEGILDEDFVYSDGTKQKRIWRMKKMAGGRYEGKADDVLGLGTGQQAGNAFRWGYTLLLPVDKSTYEVQFDDWMYQIDDQVVINKAVMSKFGITLGELVVNFKRAP